MYEFLDAEGINGSTGKIPVPPQETRDRVKFPDRHQYECLHKDRASEHTKAFYDVAVKYLKNFPKHEKLGQAPVFAGPPGAQPWKTAAALGNELAMRYTAQTDINVLWLCGKWAVPSMLNGTYSATYNSSLRNNAMRAKVLILDDVLAAVETPGGRALVDAIYSYRNDHLLPTIVSIVTPVDNQDVAKLLAKAYGPNFLEYLRMNGPGLLIRG